LTVPVVVHTGTGPPFGLPSTVLPRAREYSDVKVVLASAGPGLFPPEAHVVAREVSNVYVAPAWSRGVDIKFLIDELGPSRVMFAADLPANEPAELATYRALGLFSFQQHLVLGQTAVDTFALQGVPDLPSDE
jgi:predicted TIM-barrel fold metal-dependent hydrolase